MEALQFVANYYVANNLPYHNLNHIMRMISDAYRYGDMQKIIHIGDTYSHLRNDLYYAILFHDVIYIPLNTDIKSNEELSSKEFEYWFTTYKHYDFVSRPHTLQNVKDMILATKHHFDGIEYDSYFTNLLLDLDLMSFTDSYFEFLQTNKNIKSEYYSFYDKTIVNNMRDKFLRNILEKNLLKFRVINNKEYFEEVAYNNIRTYLSDYNRHDY